MLTSAFDLFCIFKRTLLRNNLLSHLLLICYVVLKDPYFKKFMIAFAFDLF